MSQYDFDMTELTAFHDGHANEQREEFSLPKTDGGWRAWTFLFACFMLEALVWGFPFSFGVFQTYYASHEPFSSDANSTAAVGTTATGIMYLAAPLMSLYVQRYPHLRRVSSFLALAVLVASLVAASFAQTVGHLMLTQGVMYALGGLVLYFPAIQILDEWFVRRKGLAYGIMWAGTGAAGVVFPFLFDWMLDKYGFRTTLRISAIFMAVALTPATYFLKPRIPLPATRSPRPVDLSFVKTVPFWLLQIGNITEGLGYFMPSLYLPAYANRIGLPALTGTLSLSLYNTALIIGSFAIGLIIDRFHVTTGILLCTIGSALSIFILWGFALSQPLIYVFAIAYGVSAGGFATTWSGCAGLLRGSSDTNVDTGMVIALFAAGKGVGSVVSGPLSESLLSMDAWRGQAGGAYGTGYGPVLVFAGLSALLGGIGWVGKRVGLL